jgi:UDP-3-O-[3-hydroxymyristoyl] N-acetylglucosamine deacetylase
MSLLMQHTIQHSVHCYGNGLHSGLPAGLSLYPAPENTGIVFVRTDLVSGDNEIKADFRNVTETMLGTTIANHDRVSVSTIEHLMAAIWACGIDNLRIEIDGPEVPIMEGASESFLFLLECAGVETQKAARQIIKVLKPITIEDQGATITLQPSDRLMIDLEIRYKHPTINTQKSSFDSEKSSFKMDLCRARTFCLLEEVEMMRSRGLAKGGSLENAIVVGEEGVLNEGGLRYPDEFVRHKILDCIGDMYLAGHILTHIQGDCSGHRVNNMVLRRLFEDQTAWGYAQQNTAAVA